MRDVSVIIIFKVFRRRRRRRVQTAAIHRERERDKIEKRTIINNLPLTRISTPHSDSNLSHKRVAPPANNNQTLRIVDSSFLFCRIYYPRILSKRNTHIERKIMMQPPSVLQIYQQRQQQKK